MCVKLPHLADGVTELGSILNVVYRVLAMLVTERALAGDHTIEGINHLFCDRAQVDDIAEHWADVADQAAGRADHLSRIAMGHDQPRVRINRGQIIEEERMPRVFERPVPAVLRLQKLDELLVEPEGWEIAR